MIYSNFDSIKIQIASPDQIRKWAYRVLPNGQVVGEVTCAETLNYRTHKPEVAGLFCERIFGPIKDWECRCGRYKLYKQKSQTPLICENCLVEVTSSKIRRYRIGCIELAAPIAHIWYFKSRPSALSQILNLKRQEVEDLIYFIDKISSSSNKYFQKKLIKNKPCLLNTTIFYEFDSFFESTDNYQMGAEAVSNLLMLLNLEKLFKKLSLQFKQIRPKFFEYTRDFVRIEDEILSISDNRSQKLEKQNLRKQRKDIRKNLKRLFKEKPKVLKRLRIIKNFGKTQTKPEWLILTVLPVLPPDLRPMVQFNGGQLATSDFNDLYKRIINRNNRLKKFKTFFAPKIIIRNETRLLQDSIDSLIDNKKQGKFVPSLTNRPLKSLSEVIEGKQGRFRQNLLGKRVDYSGRSVIVVDPQLKLHQCGLPKEMAIELFQPFLLQKLISKGLAPNIKVAKKQIQHPTPHIYKILKEVLKNHPILLNRAPSLHRLSIQAFEPVLVNSRAIKLHPLVCPAFNADFDGDQMAVHLPLSKEARTEARLLMLATNNLVSPATGQPISAPSQDMILGCYYLTTFNDAIRPNRKLYFSNLSNVINAYYHKKLFLHEVIWVKVKMRFHNFDSSSKLLELHIQSSGKVYKFYKDYFCDQTVNYIFIRTTVGRVLFNKIIHDSLI